MEVLNFCSAASAALKAKDKEQFQRQAVADLTCQCKTHRPLLVHRTQ